MPILNLDEFGLYPFVHEQVQRAVTRLAKCGQISIFAIPVAFTAKYREIMENTGKYDLQPSTFKLVISIIEVI